MPVENIPVKLNYSQPDFAICTSWYKNGGMNRFREIRKARRLNQTELSEMVNCSQGTISKIEKGEANPTLELIEALAEALQTTPAALFGLPELQQRAVDAFQSIDPSMREHAIAVLEGLAPKK